MRAYLALLLLALASCRESSTVESDAGISPPAVALAPSSVEGARPATSNTAQDAGAPPPSAPFQSKPTPEWNVDFFAVDVVGLVVRTRRVEVVSVGPVRDEDLLTGLPAGTIPGTTRTTFSDGSTYTVSEHKVAKRPYIATLDLKEGLSIEQGDMDLDGHEGVRNSVYRPERRVDAVRRWASLTHSSGSGQAAREVDVQLQP
ncbi:MAG: hypothetical protein AB1730_28850, partial [Myxococcota bacterium]